MVAHGCYKLLYARKAIKSLKIKTKTKAAKKFDLKKTKLQSLKKNKSGKNKNK